MNHAADPAIFIGADISGADISGALKGMQTVSSAVNSFARTSVSAVTSPVSALGSIASGPGRAATGAIAGTGAILGAAAAQAAGFGLATGGAAAAGQLLGSDLLVMGLASQFEAGQAQLKALTKSESATRPAVRRLR